MGVYLLGALALLAIVSFVLIRRAERASAERMVKEFGERWPDRRMICSHHQYGVSHELVSGDHPVPEHDCIERDE